MESPNRHDVGVGTTDSLRPLEQVDVLSSLPSALLVSNVLPLVTPHSLCCLATCSAHFKDAISTDDVWQPLCEARNWGPFPKGTSWQQGFGMCQRRLCVECGGPTRYEFQLLGCRLCEPCEHKHPRYSLVTACEAQERYGLSEAQLALLPDQKLLGVTFYLRKTVADLSERNTRGSLESATTSRGHLATSSNPASRDHQADADDSASDDGSDEEADGDGMFMMEGDGQREAARMAARQASAQRKADDKAARKANKKQVKEERRQKRLLKAVGASGNIGAKHRKAPTSYENPVKFEDDPVAAVTNASSRKGKGSRKEAGAGSNTSNGRHRRRMGNSPLAEDSFPLEGQLLAPGSSPKAKSGWLAERERLMCEWGEFGISGLVLATD